MAKVILNMITQRSIEEGAAMEKGKTNPDYFEACSICEMNPEDMKKLGIWKNTNVRVTSECGSVIVKAIEPTQVPARQVLLISGRVYGQTRLYRPGPSPQAHHRYSGFPVTIEPAPQEKLKSALELVQGSVGLWKGGK